MTTQEMIDRLLAVGDPASQQTLLQAIAAQRNGAAAAILKAEADRLLRADVRRALEVARPM